MRGRNVREGAVLDLFGLGDRPVARKADPETSHAAADSVTREYVCETQQRILAALRLSGPQTDEEILRSLGLDSRGPVSPSGARSRRAELVARGLVEWTGLTRPLKTGRQARVWRLRPHREHDLVERR